MKDFQYNGIKQPNRNSLLWRDESVDGMKTGRTDEAGYCLVSSAERDDMRVISVVLGTSSAKARIDGSQALLNYGFRFFETRCSTEAARRSQPRAHLEAEKELTPLGLPKTCTSRFPRGSSTILWSPYTEHAGDAAGAGRAGQPLAELQVSLNGDQFVHDAAAGARRQPGRLVFWQRTSGRR